MTKKQSIHPFPAKMAPDVALAAINKLPEGSKVLDPMAGSGTVLRTAAEEGYEAIGFDLDPLAVLISQAWTTPIDADELELAAQEIVDKAKKSAKVGIDWIDRDEETKAFVDYWFHPNQQQDLRLLAALLNEDESIPVALKIALSRIIITKDCGASLARDVSHSRPHRVRAENGFNVFYNFSRAARRIASALRDSPLKRAASIKVGDARTLRELDDNSIDSVVTSPPYLNAIDYLRGHRLSLVWLGYRISELRSIRSASIGSERSPDPQHDKELLWDLLGQLPFVTELPAKIKRLFGRYVLDLHAMLSEIRRVLKDGSCAVIVVGDSTLRGNFISNSMAVTRIAETLGLVLTERYERQLPQSNRYLPPPRAVDGNGLDKRMKSEVVLRFQKEQGCQRPRV